MKSEDCFYIITPDGEMQRVKPLGECPEITAAAGAGLEALALDCLEPLQLTLDLSTEQMTEICGLVAEAAQQATETVNEIIAGICKAMGQFGETLQEAVSQLDKYYAALSEVSNHRHHHPAKRKNRRFHAAVKLQCTPDLPTLHLKQAKQCKRFARSDLCGIT